MHHHVDILHSSSYVVKFRRDCKQKEFVSIPDASLNEAARILRLLHIEELRELQTKINEAIVAVQAIIADPKTDHRLGKVGR